MLIISPDAPNSLTESAAFEDRHVRTSDGRRLYYREYNPAGQGTPVLCLSGITRNSNDFHRLALHLAGQGRRVLALDYRGRGRSDYDVNWRNYRPMRLLRDVNGLTHSLHLKHAIVIGTSLGGLLLMGLAALRPGFIRAAVINDIGPEVGGPGIGRIVSYIGHDHVQPNWDAAMRHLRTMFPRLGLAEDADWRMLAEGTFRLREDGLLHSDWDPAIARCMTNGSRSPVPLWLVFRALAHVPALVVRGGNSDVLSEATLARMKQVKPDLTTLVIPGAGHTPTLDEAASRAAIGELLRHVR